MNKEIHLKSENGVIIYARLWKWEKVSGMLAFFPILTPPRTEDKRCELHLTFHDFAGIKTLPCNSSNEVPALCLSDGADMDYRSYQPILSPCLPAFRQTFGDR